MRDRSVIRLAEPPAADMVSMFDKRDFAMRDIAFNGGGLLERGGRGGYSGFRPCVLAKDCRRFAVIGCTFLGFDTAGLLLNVCFDTLVADNRAELGRAASTPN